MVSANSAFWRGLHTTRCATRLTSKSYSQAECVPSLKVTCNVPRQPRRKSRMLVAWVAMIDARKLAELLRAGLLSPVYHGQNSTAAVKHLGRRYATLTGRIGSLTYRIVVQAGEMCKKVQM